MSQQYFNETLTLSFVAPIFNLCIHRGVKKQSLSSEAREEEKQPEHKFEKTDIQKVEVAKKSGCCVLFGNDESQENQPISYIHSSFTHYSLYGLNNILQLRLVDLELLQSIKILQGFFFSQQNNNIIELLQIIITSKNNTILVPLNIFNKHAVGLIFERTEDDKIQIKYIDSENREIPKEFKQLIVDNLANKVNFQQITTEQQKYANCGVEVIENFILYLTGKRVSQEKAIELHSKLVENALLNIDSSGIHLLFWDSASSYYSHANSVEQNNDYNQLLPAQAGSLANACKAD